MGSRRLDISSLLCDDPPPAFSPLEALVHAATEERKKLEATHEQPPPRPYHDQEEQPHRPQELDPRTYELERRRRIQEDELRQMQQLEAQKAQEAEYQRQKEMERRIRAQQEHERRRREEEEERRRREHYERLRESERQREYEQQRLQEERMRMLDQQRHREEQELLHRQREQELAEDRHRRHRAQPVITPAISHLILPSRADHAGPLTSAVPEEPRPIKKRRYSASPTRPVADDKERIAREREKMFAGEIGYGRTDSPVTPASHPPRRPGSGHGHTRKPVAVADLLSDKEPLRSPETHRLFSPLAARRSPPGSQIGRAKAARKSDEHLREPPSRAKEDPPPPRVTLVEDARTKKSTLPPPPNPPPPPKAHNPKSQQEDAHEWFLHQYDEEPSPTTSARPEPPHTPSPSLSPTTSSHVPPVSVVPKSPPASHKPLTPKTAAVTLEQELEELVSEPAISSTTTTAVAITKDRDMDIVDLAVSELVETLENDDDAKHEPGVMEVDVEDELLSLVDDRPPPPPPPPPAAPAHSPTTAVTLSSSARRLPGSAASSHASVTTSSAAQSSATKSAPPTHRIISEARPVSPSTPVASVSAIPSTSAARPISNRSTSERGSMPPPSSTSVGATSKKAPERSGSVAPPPVKKKKESTAKGSSKAKSLASTSNATTATKPRAKAVPKGRKTSSENTPSGPSTAPAPSRATKTIASKAVSSVSRSRSASVIPTPTGPEPDAVKAEKQEEEEESEAENEDNKLYCVCKTKYDEDRFMIACDRCDEWYHTQCVQMPDLEVDLVDQFICPPCIEKHPHLHLKTTYKQRCLYGLRHPNPSSPEACHKAARGAFSKYCSDECGVKYMQSRIDSWAKKGGKTEKLWESVKHAEKREGVVIRVDQPETKLKPNGCVKMELDGLDVDVKPPKQQHVVPPKKSKVTQETERLNVLLDSVIKLREEIKRGMEIVVWREKLLQLASERADTTNRCGWDQRLCLDDEEWADIGAAVLESYEDAKAEGVKEEEDGDTDMDVDNTEEQWWCPGKKVCDRHAGWQTVRYKDVCKEKEKKEEALVKLTTREREIRKNIEDMLDPRNNDSSTNINVTSDAKKTKDTTSNTPLKASNTKTINGHLKSKATMTAGDALKKGKKRKAPA